MTKRVSIVLLVGTNLFLLACLVLTAYSPPQALAQEVEGAGRGFIVVSGEGQLNNDVIYVIDLENRFLHAFRTTFPRSAGTPIQGFYVDTRDLRMDFPRPRAK